MNWIWYIRPVVLSLFVAVACVAPESPKGVIAVELTSLAGVWFDIVHLPHPLLENCSNSRSLYRNPQHGQMDFIFECQQPDSLWYSVSGSFHRHAENNDLLVFDFDSVQIEVLFELSYWILAADFSEGWMAVGHPDEDWFWLLSRSPTMESSLRLKILAEIDARGLYGYPSLAQEVELTHHDQ